MKTLPDSIRDKEKLQPLTLDLAESAKIISEMQEEVHLLPDSQRKEGEIMLGVQEEKETLPISLPCISEGEVDGSVTFSSVESTESITREPETSPLFVSGRIPTPELIGTTEGRKAAIIPSVIITPSAKDMVRFYLLKQDGILKAPPSILAVSHLLVLHPFLLWKLL